MRVTNLNFDKDTTFWFKMLLGFYIIIYFCKKMYYD